jgi:hypothetical protein
MTAAKFKPLVFPMLGFALSNKANNKASASVARPLFSTGKPGAIQCRSALLFSTLIG